MFKRAFSWIESPEQGMVKMNEGACMGQLNWMARDEGRDAATF
jgi:hypothetical protein